MERSGWRSSRAAVAAGAALLLLLFLALSQAAIHGLCACSAAVPRCGVVCAAHSQLGEWTRPADVVPAALPGSASATPRNGSTPALFSAARRGGRYDAIRVYLLVAFWSPERQANAARLCAGLEPQGVVCTHIKAVKGDALTNASLAELETQRIISLAPLPQPTRKPLLPVPHALAPLFAEHPTNLLNASYNWRWDKAIGNTVGTIRCLQAMAADAAAADAAPRAAGAPAPSSRTLYVYMEDDSDIPDLRRFAERIYDVAERLPRAGWDLLLLTPPPSMCERSAWLPPPWHVGRGGIMAPRYSFSRTTAVLHSAQGVAALLAALPANNIVDMWYRALMRAGLLKVRIHCDDIVRPGGMAARQAHRRALLEP